MANLEDIVNYTAQTLDHQGFTDMSVNGLQIEGCSEVSKIAATVDAALETAKMAKDCGAQILLAHHGIFWGKDTPVVGARRELFKFFIENQLSLLVSHLPLDAHEQFGNNFQLAKHLDLDSPRLFLPYQGRLIGCLAENKSSKSLSQIVDKLGELHGSTKSFTCLEFGPKTPKTIGICSGSAVEGMELFKHDGFDTYITGEPKQHAYHYAKENELNLICAGHYATETLGVQAFAQHLSSQFSLDWEFLDRPTGI